MSLRENIRFLFEPRGLKNAREIIAEDAAREEEGQATADYLRGKISLQERQKIYDKLYPLTKLDFRKFAQDVRG